MQDLHSLLRRQMRKHLGGEERLPGISREFIAAVDAAYWQADEDRKLVERSLELSSRELLAANAELRGMASELEVRVAERTAELEEATARLRSELDERRRLEQELLQAQKMEAIGRLAGGIAHDFNNLLTAILGYGDFLQNAVEDDARLSGFVLEIQNAGKRAATLTQQLLAFSRKQRLNPTVLDLNTLVTDLGKLLQRMIREDVEMVTVAAPRLRAIHADQGQIEQAIMNLVVNARDAMPVGGKIVVATRNVDIDVPTRAGADEMPPGRYVALSVTDTGGGMDADVLNHVFEPFFTTKELGKGTGLGLATVHGIVLQSDGYITVDSAPGAGAVFTLYFPAVTDRSPLQRPRPESLGIRGGSEAVLLVEDESAVRSLARRVLESAGYGVVEARYGDEALLISERHEGPIDILLTDMVMPGMSGNELAERLTLERPRMKVLFMSGYADEMEPYRDGENVHGAFLPKPFLPDDMLRAVRCVLDGA